MKKPLFVITEIFLSLVFAAAAAATAVVAVDIKTDIFHVDKLDPLHISSLIPNSKENKKEEKVKKEISEIMLVENKQASETQESLQKLAENKIKDFLKEQGIRQSMDGKSRWADNIMIERWFRSLKSEKIYINEYRSPKALRMDLADYISEYNDVRPHQALDYKTPSKVFADFFTPAA